MCMRSVLLLGLCILVAVSGCAPATPAASADVLESSQPRQAEPDVSSADIDALVRGNGEFAFSLYHEITRGNDNVFYSPYSISLALAMTYAGARGETEAEMGDAMRFDLPGEGLHQAFNFLDQELGSRGEGARGKDEEGFRLNIANAIWGQKDYPFLAEYLDVLARNYGAGLRVLDFEAAPEDSREIINDWVETETEGRIQDLLPRGTIDALTRLVLTNAVYFNAAWASQFDDAATSDGVFHLLDGSSVTVPIMNQSARFRYADVGDYEVVELPYDGGELSMVVFVPRQGRFSAFEQNLDFLTVSDSIQTLESNQVILGMPKFRVEASFSLKDALTGLGMDRAFDPGAADFSGMDGGHDLYITDVVHKAFVDVDEAGTEAAAATAAIVGATSAPARPVELTIDRPFVFLIRDVSTDAILFVGRVADPS